ncbi:MAG: hypothetical protein QNJ44_11950 [Rhodobacter sp.]|nr:hypothetical protein [Rhodobacter sp.]
MHWLLIEEAIERCPNAEVVAHNLPSDRLETAIEEHAPDVIILGTKDAEDELGVFERWLDAGRKTRRIITLFDGPSLIQLREWRLAVEFISDVSVNSLRDAIEGGR